MTFQDFSALLASLGFKTCPVSESDFNALEHTSEPYLTAIAYKVAQGFDFMFWADALLTRYKKG